MLPALLLGALAASPSPGPLRLAVLEFEVAGGVDLDRVYFSDKVRGVAGEQPARLFVMTRESVAALLQGAGKTLADCEGACEVEVGRQLGADYVVSGRITRVGSQLALTLRLHATADGRLLKTAEALARDADGLVSGVGRAAAQLLAPLLSPAAAAPVAPSPRGPPPSASAPAPSPSPNAGTAAERLPAPASDPRRTDNAPAGLPRFATEPRSGLEFALLPAGSFEAGCAEGDSDCQPDEGERRRVSVSSFWMARTLTTGAALARCPKETCFGPQRSSGLCTGRQPELPQNCVPWEIAGRFCAWAGGRLPSADEWEYAARSGGIGRFPWGESGFTPRKANACDRRCLEVLSEREREQLRGAGAADEQSDDGFATVSPPRAFPEGATPWGLFDMAGNLWQWTSTDYRLPQAERAALQPEQLAAWERLESKEVRGGSWANPWRDLRASNRHRLAASFGGPIVGFRCALPAGALR